MQRVDINQINVITKKNNLSISDRCDRLVVSQIYRIMILLASVLPAPLSPRERERVNVITKIVIRE